jgi:zinc protease
MRVKTGLPLALPLLFWSLHALGGDEPPKAPAAAKPAATASTSAAAAVAKPLDPAAEALSRLSLSIQRLTLANGLRVVLYPDQSSPTVAVAVTYDVGSRHEQTGQSGFAHLFEHMMFQGSRHVKKGQHFSLITERGGTLNGTTSADRTNYFEVLPASELELALWLEADRMRALDVSAENFENQRSVVKEEYRMRYLNAPYMMGLLRLSELVFAKYPPYANPTIGKMEDLDGAKLEWVSAFYEKYYAPNNAVIAIAGNFDTDVAARALDRYFGSIPRRDLTPFTVPAALPEAAAARDRVTDKNAKTPGLFYGYLIPPSRTPEHYALELAAMVLGDGESSRLHQSLVRDRAVAQGASAWTRDYRGPDEFAISIELAEKATLEQVTKLVDAELDRLRKTPPSAAELERVKRRLKASFVFGLETNLRRASELSQFELYFGDARELTRELARYLEVTPEAVKNAAAKYLTEGRRALVEVVPAPKEVKP